MIVYDDKKVTITTQPTMNLPLPDLRQDIERIKSQRSQEESSGEKTPAKTVAPGFPMIDLTKPPPGKSHHKLCFNSFQG